MEFAESKKERKTLPGYVIFIIIFGILSVLIGLVKGCVQAQTEKTIAQYYDAITSQNSTSPEADESNTGVIPVRYKGLLVKIPKDWKYEMSDMEDGLLHQIQIESPNVDCTTILWGSTSYTNSPKEWISSVRETAGEGFSNYVPGEINKSRYCGETAYTFDYSAKMLGFTYYVRIIMFEKGGSNIMVMNVTDFKSRLSQKFLFVENTLEIL